MASLKFYNTSTNQWEIIKTDTLGSVIPNNQTWTATTNQSAFTISNGNIPDANLLNVYVDGKIRTDYTLTNSTTFIFFLGLSSGSQVFAEWFEVAVPATTGHHSTHELNGQDPIDITKLTNYSLVSTPITNLQNTQSNHESRITTIEGKNFDSRVTTLETARTSNESRITKLETNPYFHLNRDSYQNMDGSFTYVTFDTGHVSYYSGFTPGTNSLTVNQDGIYHVETRINLSGLNPDQYASLFIRVLNAGNTLNADHKVTQVGWQGAGSNNGGVWITNSKILRLTAGQMLNFLYSATEAPRTIIQLIVNCHKVSNL